MLLVLTWVPFWYSEPISSSQLSLTLYITTGNHLKALSSYCQLNTKNIQLTIRVLRKDTQSPNNCYCPEKVPNKKNWCLFLEIQIIVDLDLVMFNTELVCKKRQKIVSLIPSSKKTIKTKPVSKTTTTSFIFMFEFAILK